MVKLLFQEAWKIGKRFSQYKICLYLATGEITGCVAKRSRKRKSDDSEKFSRERLTIHSDLWVASSPSNDIIELEELHVPFPDSALTTFAADHTIVCEWFVNTVFTRERIQIQVRYSMKTDVASGDQRIRFPSLMGNNKKFEELND
ncbi:hypothetical protein OUZ56_026676 [Daphnia magna]|uniref:Uncharacterized protein n=1 Tax=Daphnia magna TaxID=35525 RepID=A0ABQ9ZMK6_9CRUS|nr:hypothetical protein OUZ56_026676 [Daphnia magna]